GGAHAALDLGGLERGPGGRGRADDPVLGAERDLRVRADVDEEADPAVAGEAGREHPGDDVAAHVRAQGGEGEGGGARVQVHAEVGGGHRRAAMMNGAIASGSGSMPSAIWVIVTLPQSTIS